MISRVGKQVEQQSYHFAIRHSIISILNNRELLTKEYITECYKKWLCTKQSSEDNNEPSTVRQLEVRVISSHALENTQEQKEEGKEKEESVTTLEKETEGLLTHNDYLRFKASREASSSCIVSFPPLEINV